MADILEKKLSLQLLHNPSISRNSLSRTTRKLKWTRVSKKRPPLRFLDWIQRSQWNPSQRRKFLQRKEERWTKQLLGLQYPKQNVLLWTHPTRTVRLPMLEEQREATLPRVPIYTQDNWMFFWRWAFEKSSPELPWRSLLGMLIWQLHFWSNFPQNQSLLLLLLLLQLQCQCHLLLLLLWLLLAFLPLLLLLLWSARNLLALLLLLMLHLLTHPLLFRSIVLLQLLPLFQLLLLCLWCQIYSSNELQRLFIFTILLLVSLTSVQPLASLPPLVSLVMST
jgi:hypothetical protein